MFEKFLPSGLVAMICALACNSLYAGPFDELIINGGFENAVGNRIDRQVVADLSNTARYTQLDSWITTTDTNKLTFVLGPNSGDTTGARGLYYDTTAFTLWGSNNGGAGPTALGPSPLGGNYIAMDGDSTHNVKLTQNVSGLIIGQAYNVSFWWAAAQQQSFNGATTEKWDVSLGGQTQSTSVYSLPIKQSMTFTATTTTAALSFLAIGTPNGLPPFALLDGVSMIAVPEPGTWTMLVLAIAGIGCVRRYRKKSIVV